MNKNRIDSSIFIHPKAIVEENARIGAGTRVWAFAHILGNTVIGEDCNICDHSFVESGVIIGSRVTVKCGVYLWDGITVSDDVFIGPNATFTNDIKPRSRQYHEKYLATELKRGCSIGANATILPGLVIGKWSMIGAGSVVTKNVPEFAMVVGNPAKKQGWICKCANTIQFDDNGHFLCQCGSAFELLKSGIVRGEINESG